MKNESEALFTETIIGEILEINRTGQYVDDDKAALPKEIVKGELTPFEKAAYTLYKRDILKYRELSSELVAFLKSGRAAGQQELACNRLIEKIGTVSKLFTFQVRHRLNLWRSVINVRKGFQVVEVPVYWTKEVKKLDISSVIEKEIGVNTKLKGSA